jgi:outer membrane lipoprotein SlyB
MGKMRRMRKLWSLTFACCAGAVLLAGCSTIPTGPSVMVLPGQGRTFEQFQYDDALCRQWCSYQLGTNRHQASAESTVTGAAVGTALGAATGAAIGAAAGDPGIGAAVGAGAGLLTGTAVGAQQGQYDEYELQRRYDISYMQCMYAKGHQVPMPRGSQRSARTYQGSYHSDVPPPPHGSPPAPPDVY